MNFLYKMRVPIIVAFLVFVGIVLYSKYKGPVTFSTVILWALFFIYQRIIADKILFKADKNARERWFLAYLIGWVVTCVINIIILKMVI